MLGLGGKREEPKCEHLECEEEATQFVDKTVSKVPLLGFRCDEHASTPDVVDVRMEVYHLRSDARELMRQVKKMNE